MKVALIAALAMVLQDVFGVLMMQYEANSLELPARRSWRDYVGGGWTAWAPAVLDQLAWMVGITTTTISVEAFAGHHTSTKVVVFAAVSAANMIGSRMGQEIGIVLLRRKKAKVGFRTKDERLADLENHVALLIGQRKPG